MAAETNPGTVWEEPENREAGIAGGHPWLEPENEEAGIAGGHPWLEPENREAGITGDHPRFNHCKYLATLALATALATCIPFYFPESFASQLQTSRFCTPFIFWSDYFCLWE